MSSVMGHAGFLTRPVRPDDPLVCPLCGLTIGTRRLEEPEAADRLATVRAAHEPVCRDRRAHMAAHRTADPCPRCAALAPAPPDTAGSPDTATYPQGD